MSRGGLSGHEMRSSMVLVDVRGLARDARRAELAPAAACLRGGGLVVLPTETVYGLGAHAFDEAAVARVFAVKGRPATDPLIVHVHPGWPLSLVLHEPSPVVRELAARFWPGPLTIVAPKAAAVPASVTSGLDRVAVRAPAHPVALDLLDLAGVAVAAPSANRFGYVSPTTAAHVLADIGPRCDYVVDGGPTAHGIESTVVAVEPDDDDGRRGARAVLRVLRHGAVTVEQLALVDGVRVVDAVAASAAEAPGDDLARPAPGMLTRHYAPSVRTVAVRRSADAARGLDVLVACTAGAGTVRYLGYDERDLPPGVAADPRVERVSLGSLHDLAAVARGLYGALRDADASGAAVLLVELTEQPGLGRAIDDRLRRAASGQEC